ncbi:MAG: DUF2341 domain-containing protein [Bacteroidales bacterium]|nr:DUF2341 domain-containing protein [Bacteroidales bacterium]
MKNIIAFSASDVNTAASASCYAGRTHSRYILSILLLLALVSFSPKWLNAQGPGASWTYYRVVGLSPATSLANQQVEVTLSSGEYTNMKSDGSDLRFYDYANNNCEYWIESWNTAGTSTIWVKVPTSGSDALVLYYGNAGATAVSNGNTTFEFFDDFNGSSLGANWQQNTSGGSVSVSGGIVTITCSTNSTGQAYISSEYTPAGTSYLLEAKHQEGAYNRNRFYASNSLFGGSPTGFDYGYFSETATAASTSKVFWNGYPTSTSMTSNTNYITQWRITDGSTYNWYTYLYSTGAAVTNGSRTTTVASNMRFVTFGVTEVSGTTTKVDWVRLRQYVASEPAVTVGSQTSSTAPSNPITYSSSGYFIVPEGITSITVECWGAGGRGGTTSGDAYGGGGGGGAYSSSVLTVSSGNVYNLTVGAGSSTTSAGGDSWFGSASTVMAKGGNSAPTAGGVQSGATGGAATSGVGTIKYSGGNGASGVNSTTDFGGGGGSSAGTSANGVNATNQNGATAPSGGGNGGAGKYSSDGAGSAGLTPGGGGGGALRNGGTNYNGGNGANGQVKISWCTPPAAPTVVSPITYCLNATAVPLTATGSNLLWYTTATGGIGSSTAPTPSTSANGTTSYYVSQTVGCEGPRAQIDVVVYSPNTAINSTVNASCNGALDGSITITANNGVGPYQFSIDNGVNYTSGNTLNPYTFNGLGANVQFKIRVKDSSGCQSISIP